LWDLNEGKNLYSLEGGDAISQLVFSPTKYWLCAATEAGIKIWDLESKTLIAELNKTMAEFQSKTPNQIATPISLAWNGDGSILFAGYTDNLIRVFEVSKS